MSGLGEHFPEFQTANGQVSPAELDRYEQYQVINPTISATWFGTAAGGTAGQEKALVIISKTADYPRNLLYGVVGTADMGGVWVVNAKDQFGQPWTETVTLGTAAAGTPGTAVAGTKICAEIVSGTFTVASDGVGLGSARIGAAIGTAATQKFRLGLPYKIAAVTDVKAITWTSASSGTAINGGSVQSSTYVDTTNHAIMGSSIMAGTEVYSVLFKTTWNNYQKNDLAKL